MPTNNRLCIHRPQLLFDWLAKSPAFYRTIRFFFAQGPVDNNRLTVFDLGLPGSAGTRRNTHPLTPILIIKHPLSTSSIYYNP